MRAKRVTYAEEHGDKSEEKWYWYGCSYDEMKGEHQPQKYQLVLKGQRPDPSFKFKKKKSQSSLHVQQLPKTLRQIVNDDGSSFNTR